MDQVVLNEIERRVRFTSVTFVGKSMFDVPVSTILAIV